MTYVQINQTLSVTPLLISSDGSLILRYSANEKGITGISQLLVLKPKSYVVQVVPDSFVGFGEWCGLFFVVWFFFSPLRRLKLTNPQYFISLHIF